MNPSLENALRIAGVDIRLATEADADELAELRLELLIEVNNPEPPPPTLRPALRDYFRQMLSSGQHVAHLALVEGRIIATSGLVFFRCPPSYSNPSGREGYIMNMYTRPPWRGRGIARILLQKLLVSARDAGCDRVTLHAEPRARPIYQRMGFRPSDQEMRKSLL